MKRVFLDTNVVLDAVIPSRINYQSANLILSACDYGEIEGCVSILTVANTAYILKRGRTQKQMVSLLRACLAGLLILPMDGTQLLHAYTVDAPDFEDILQYECAKAADCERNVTSNTKHFRFCKDIDVISTIDYAKKL